MENTGQERFNKYMKGKHNHINEKFNDIFFNMFEVALSNQYQDITPFGTYFKHHNKDNISEYYIQQPEIEKELQLFYNPVVNVDKIKCLIGYTGMGKTTLIKNYFRILNREPFFDESNKSMICYLSFYAEKIDDLNYKKNIEKLFVSFLSNIRLNLQDEYCRKKNTKPIETDVIYDFIKETKGSLLITESMFDEPSKDAIIKDLEKSKPIELYSSYIKYYLNELSIRNLVLIADDIEVLHHKYYDLILDKFLSIHSCLTFTKRTYCVKSLITLRSHTFRKVNNPKRFDPKDTILKKNIPNITEIIQRRFENIEKYYDDFGGIGERNSWDSAKKILFYLINNIDKNFSHHITCLTNNNIPESLHAILYIISNKKWFASREQEHSKGVRVIRHRYYAASDLEAMYRSLVLGETKIYNSYNDCVTPNIFIHNNEISKESAILSFYILAFYRKNYYIKNVPLYDYDSASPKEFISEFLQDFNIELFQDKDDFIKMTYKCMESLYTKRLLLRSIYENDIGDDIKEFSRTHKLYISLRGNEMFNMLRDNSMLLELFKDEYNPLINSTTYSYETEESQRLKEIINFIELLFYEERNYIISINDFDFYSKNLNNHFLVSYLLEGVYNTLFRFRNKNITCYNNTYSVYNSLFDKIISYSKEISKSENVKLTLPSNMKRLSRVNEGIN